MADDIAAEYESYERRFEEKLGSHPPGDFVKYNGRLVKRLGLDEFESLYKEYMGLASHYIEGIDRGDTVNDVVVKLIRDHAASLILTSPV